MHLLVGHTAARWLLSGLSEVDESNIIIRRAGCSSHRRIMAQVSDLSKLVGTFSAVGAAKVYGPNPMSGDTIVQVYSRNSKYAQVLSKVVCTLV